MGNENLTDYILISQDKSFVEHFNKQTDNNWVYQSYSEISDILRIKTIDCELSVREIYDRVEFEIQPDFEESEKQ
jgi:hypothetical protein